MFFLRHYCMPFAVFLHAFTKTLFHFCLIMLKNNKERKRVGDFYAEMYKWYLVCVNVPTKPQKT